MNAALRIEEPVEMIRVMPAPRLTLKIECSFSVESFEVPIGFNPAVQPRQSANPEAARLFSDVVVTSRITASDTLCVKKTLRP
jgi:hypothetical protein